jgi:hypothetical protein
MWKFKTDRMGNTTPAVNRRLTNYRRLTNQSIDLTDAKSRREFGFNFLEFVSNA